MEFMVGQHTNVLYYEKGLQPYLAIEQEKQKIVLIIRDLMWCIPVSFFLAYLTRTLKYVRGSYQVSSKDVSETRVA